MSKTICDLKVELKRKGIKGITGLNKSGLQKLLDGGKSIPKKDKKEDKKNKKEEKKEEKREKPKKEEKKEEIKKPLLLKLKPNETETKKTPPLANKSLVELYKMNLNLSKTIEDNVNSAEAERSKTILEKVKVAFRYNRQEFINKIKKLKKEKLEEMKEDLTKQYQNTNDEDAKKIYGGQIAEINKLL